MSSRRRRILWIGKSPTNGMTGDEVFDRKTLAACRAQGCDVHVYYPVPVSRLREAAVLATGVLPYQRTRFATKHNRHAIVELTRRSVHWRLHTSRPGRRRRSARQWRSLLQRASLSIH